MIKVITIITKFIIVTLIALFFSSCIFSRDLKSITGSGHVTSENRMVQGSFKSIEVSNAIDLEVEQSGKTEIIVEADDNLQNEITTKVENGVLIIACKYSSLIDVESRKVIVKMPIINGLQASSASTIKSRNTLKGENIDLKASSAADVNLSLEFDAIYCKASSGSSINIDGKALKLETNSSSGSTIDAKDLLVNEVIAKASSGGSINVHPIVNLDAKASSGGDINYNVTPKRIEKRTSSGGSVEQE
ncbi:head GIN domain-containing protein [uncultured Flavobacterium sp.]|uniref:head GIN domain-containing protein n=1 Tax=uncultured Flavobacterium sp. TaxID=165435 RepID=UPI0030CA220C